jgi:DNA-binding NtrC family response regulator
MTTRPLFEQKTIFFVGNSIQNQPAMTDFTVMYVDDEETNLFLFELSFARQFNVVTTNSPFDALEMIKEREIKVVVTDYKMPEMNGMELISQIKQLKPDTICIIVSGYVGSEVIADMTLLHKYIMKPWKKNELIEAITSAIA